MRYARAAVRVWYVFVVFLVSNVVFRWYSYLGHRLSFVGETAFNGSSCGTFVECAHTGDADGVEVEHPTIPIKDSDVYCTSARNKGKAYLTIGIPVVNRPVVGIDYFKYTVSSVLRGVTSPDTRIMVFVSDANRTTGDAVVRHLAAFHRRHLSAGIVDICAINPEAYPESKNAGNPDSAGSRRLQWRVKQALDYATMLHVVRDRTLYYLHLEDDVICVEGYLEDIRKFIGDQDNQPWTLLEFSRQGFIGKLLKASSLEHLARYIWMFRYQAPVDWLLMRFRSVVKNRYIYRRRALFHHVGLYSSLVGQLRKDAYRIMPREENGRINCEDETTTKVRLQNSASYLYKTRMKDADFVGESR